MQNYKLDIDAILGEVVSERNFFHREDLNEYWGD